MFATIISKLVVWLLRHKQLLGESRSRVMDALLTNFNAVKIRDVIDRNEVGNLVINGRELSNEETNYFIQSCIAYRDSNARKVLRDQAVYEATKMGIHNGLTPETIQFAKAVLWWYQEQERLLNYILGE